MSSGSSCVTILDWNQDVPNFFIPNTTTTSQAFVFSHLNYWIGLSANLPTLVPFLPNIPITIVYLPNSLLLSSQFSSMKTSVPPYGWKQNPDITESFHMHVPLITCLNTNTGLQTASSICPSTSIQFFFFLLPLVNACLMQITQGMLRQIKPANIQSKVGKS